MITSGTTRPGPVVVGVASRAAGPTVRYAAGEASTRGAALRIVTARPAAAAPHPYLDNEVAEAHRDAALRLLTELAGEVTTGWPGLTVTTELVAGPPAPVLRAAAADADLLVVGAADASPFVEAISGSVPGELLTTTPCPLAVMPRREQTAPAPAPVVVAFDEPETSHAALAYAFAAAARSGRALTVLHCALGADRRRFDEARALPSFRELYPDIPATVEISTAPPRDALAAASRTAAVLVLGSRGRGPLASGLFGSVSRDLIRRSTCPVVVARATNSHPTASTP